MRTNVLLWWVNRMIRTSIWMFSFLSYCNLNPQYNKFITLNNNRKRELVAAQGSPCRTTQILTFKVLPERPMISPSLASTTVHVVTSPLPVVSIISIILGFPSVVIWKHKQRRKLKCSWIAPSHFSFLLIKKPKKQQSSNFVKL